ncbi:MAG: hypothetical protein LH491_09765 [Pseudoxanthomonas sp.]|nr:hypothetical protein [Pseudoxanthomonas sp.]
MSLFYAAWHDCGMCDPETLHRSPRHPHAWAWLLLASRAAVAAAWWGFGWWIGMPLLLASHAPIW